MSDCGRTHLETFNTRGLMRKSTGHPRLLLREPKQSSILDSSNLREISEELVQPTSNHQLRRPTIISLNMSVRVVARIRPLIQSENAKDAIVEAVSAEAPISTRPSIVKIPNPKNFSEDFTFQFSGVYDEQATQQELFDAEGKLDESYHPPRTLH